MLRAFLAGAVILPVLAGCQTIDSFQFEDGIYSVSRTSPWIWGGSGASFMDDLRGRAEATSRTQNRRAAIVASSVRNASAVSFAHAALKFRCV